MLNKKMRAGRFSALMLAVILLICLIPGFAFAQENTSVSFSVKYFHGENPVKDVKFRIYQVSDSISQGKFNPNSVFSNYSVNFNCENGDEWRRLAFTLSGYVSRDKITPFDISVTNAEGIASFSIPSKAANGLFLAVGEQNTEGEYIYTPEPFMIISPGSSGGEYSQASVKYDKNETNKKISLTAVKVWKNDNKANRPFKITVELLKNGMVYNKAVLNKDNNWRFTWNNLDSSAEWMIVEMSVPDGYTASVEQLDKVFAITNTYDQNIPPHTTKPGGDNPNKPNNPNKPGNPNLPNTGMMQWPIPVLAAGGIVIFSIGYIKRRSCDDDNE